MRSQMLCSRRGQGIVSVSKKNIFISFDSDEFESHLGQKFAMLEIKSTISKLIRNFELSVADGYELRVFLELVLKPEGGVKIHFKNRDYQ